MGYDEKRQAEETEKLNAMTERTRAFCNALIQKLRDSGHEVETANGSLNYWNREDSTLSFDKPHKVDGARVSVNFTLGHTKGFRTCYTGKVFMSIGDFGGKTNFPEGKNGFNVDKAFNALMDRISTSRARERSRQQGEQLRVEANAVRDELNDSLGLSTYTGVSLEPSYGKFNFKALQITEAEVRVMVAALAQLRGKA